jgi:hypothetical protein
MGEHLWPLLQLDAASIEELKEAYRQIFLETYIIDKSGKEVLVCDWLGNRIRFNPHPSYFNHAFSESSSYRFKHGEHDIPFSLGRAQRIMWIKEVLAATRGTVERRHQIKTDSRGRPKKRRILLVTEEQYCVVLEETETMGVLDFVTAFKADRGYLEKIKRESVLIETKKPQS